MNEKSVYTRNPGNNVHILAGLKKKTVVSLHRSLAFFCFLKSDHRRIDRVNFDVLGKSETNFILGQVEGKALDFWRGNIDRVRPDWDRPGASLCFHDLVIGVILDCG